MNENELVSSTDYDKRSQTESTPDAKDHLREIDKLSEVQEELYGTGKPIKIVIRAKIIRDQD